MSDGPAARHTEPWGGAGGPVGSAFLPVPAGFRASGSEPFFRPGQVILWRSERRARWEGAGTLKVAPTGAPWSAWRFPGLGGAGWT